jgi:hypothetical protein
LVRKFVVTIVCHLLQFKFRNRWEENMNLKTFGYVAFIAAAATAFIIGSGEPTLAAKKKKAMAPEPTVCSGIYKPVCGVRGGHKFTYANSCFAAKDGAKVVAQHACTVKKGKAHKAKAHKAKAHKAKAHKAKKAMKKPAKKAMKKAPAKKKM